MGWAVGYDSGWHRDVGYGVPAICDYPDCGESIDRGLAFVCGGEPFGGEYGCGLYFCGKHKSYVCVDPLLGIAVDEDDYPEDDPEHLEYVELCERCAEDKVAFDPTPDTQEWIDHKMTDPSWLPWRVEHGLEQ